MKTKICKNCKKELAKNARVCPECGYKYRHFWRKLFITLVILAVIIIIPIASLGIFVETVTAPDVTIEALEAPLGVNEPFENEDFTIVMTEYEEFTDYSEFFAPTEGKKIVRAYFKFKNLRDYDVTFGYWDFECYADNNVCEAYIWDDNSMECSATVSSGRECVGWIYFEVPVESTSVEFEFAPNAFSSSKIVFKGE